MRTLLPDPPPPGFEELLERRRRWGADTHDEVWAGVLHIAPGPHERHADLQAQVIRLLGDAADAAGLRTIGEFNLGEEDDFRVPDGALVQPRPGALWNPTAALVVEIVSPRDDTWRKLEFYAAHDVAELLIVDPETRTVDWLALTADGAYEATERSQVIALSAAELAAALEWPA